MLTQSMQSHRAASMAGDFHVMSTQGGFSHVFQSSLSRMSNGTDTLTFESVPLSAQTVSLMFTRVL